MITPTSNFSTFISGLEERLESINFGRRDKTLSNVYVLPGQTVKSKNQGVWTFKDGIISSVQLIAKNVGIKYVQKNIDDYKKQKKIDTEPEDWEKLKGKAIVSQNGIDCEAEIHFYRVKKSDVIWLKITSFSDFEDVKKARLALKKKQIRRAKKYVKNNKSRK